MRLSESMRNSENCSFTARLDLGSFATFLDLPQDFTALATGYWTRVGLPPLRKSATAPQEAPTHKMTTLNPPSGRTIVLELQREMEARLYPLMYRTLAPGVFHVYLHPDDYKEVHPIAAAIVADAQQGLNSRVDELNARARWTRMVSGKQAPIEVPPGGWEIHLHPESNGELSRGELGIESLLSIPPARRYEGGAATTRIARTTVTGTIRRQMPEQLVAATAAPPPPAPVLQSVTAGGPEPKADASSRSLASSASLAAQASEAAPAPPPAAHHGDTATHESAPSAVDGSSASRAHLTYVDDEGTHSYAMRKDLISIGRGGSAHWVDVQLVTSTRVSREHCRIRRGHDGRFYLQDVSTWGTSVNGSRVQPFARQVDGSVEELGHEQLLISPARIQLADAVTIEFSLEAPR